MGHRLWRRVELASSRGWLRHVRSPIDVEFRTVSLVEFVLSLRLSRKWSSFSFSPETVLKLGLPKAALTSESGIQFRKRSLLEGKNLEL
jgi:hypothetical protein